MKTTITKRYAKAIVLHLCKEFLQESPTFSDSNLKTDKDLTGDSVKIIQQVKKELINDFEAQVKFYLK